jgi:hypothetical protein
VLAAIFDAIARFAELLHALLSHVRDNRLIALGEQRAREQALARVKETLMRAKAIDNETAASHRRRLDDAAFDASFERKDDA